MPGATSSMRRGVVAVVGTGAGGGVLVETLSRLRPDLDVVVIEERTASPNWAALDETVEYLPITERSAAFPDGTKVGIPESPAAGGASLLHGGITLRGIRADYERWANCAGCAWGPEAVNTLVDEVESTMPIELKTSVRRLDSVARSSGEQAVLDRCRERYGSAGPLDLMDAYGAGLVPSATTSDGRVLTVARTHLAAALRRPNVHLYSATRAVRLVVVGRRVTGIEVEGAGAGAGAPVLTADAVVSSAGALGSAELLLRSGIGPATSRGTRRGPQVVDLPRVGQFLFDHPTIWLRLRARGATSTLRWPWHKVLCRVPSTDPTLPHVGIEAFHDFRLRANPELAARTLVVSYMALANGAPGHVVLHDDVETSEIVLADMRPNLKDAMVEDFRELASSAQIIAAGFHAAADRIDARTVPTRSAYHFHGTCPMGTDPSSGVVDPNLRVFGLDNLFLADAGIIPIQFSANTHLITKAIGLAGARSVGEAL